MSKLARSDEPKVNQVQIKSKVQMLLIGPQLNRHLINPTPTLPLPLRDCVTIAEMVKNVMLNLF
jgi:hypothetical protein